MAPFRADHVGGPARPPALPAARERHAAGAPDETGQRAVRRLGGSGRTERKVEGTARIVAPDRLSPRRGFPPAVEGSSLPVDEQRATPALVVGVAQGVWG